MMCWFFFQISPNWKTLHVATMHLNVFTTMWRSSDVLSLFQTILSHPKHCCYCISPPVWRSSAVLLFSLFQTILSHQKHCCYCISLQCDDPVLFSCFKPFYLTKSTVATAFHYQCDPVFDPSQQKLSPLWRSLFPVSNHSSHQNTVVRISATGVWHCCSHYHQKHCCYYAFHHQCDILLLVCFPCFKPFCGSPKAVHQKHCCYYAFHHQCDDPCLCCFPCFKPFYTFKSTVHYCISPPVWRTVCVSVSIYIYICNADWEFYQCMSELLFQTI